MQRARQILFVLGRSCHWLFWSWLGLAVASCQADTTERFPSIPSAWQPSPDEIGPAPTSDSNDSSQLASGLCEKRCSAALVDSTFRFTLLHVTEPKDQLPDGTLLPKAKSLRDLLNNIWTRDLDHFVLNILFEVKAVDFSAERLDLDVGPGWYRFLDSIAEPLPGVSEVTGEAIEAFCLLEGAEQQPLTSDFQASLKRDTCAFDFDLSQQARTDSDGGFLLFHTGPVDDPIICAPEQHLTVGLADNTIPLAITKASGEFNEDCSRIVRGQLQGCIAMEHAFRICMCLNPEYNCQRQPDGASSNYCRNHCGLGWINFGEFVRDQANIPPTCTVLGKEGIQIAGDFEAERLSADRFDPQRSINCSAP